MKVTRIGQDGSNLRFTTRSLTAMCYLVLLLDGKGFFEIGFGCVTDCVAIITICDTLGQYFVCIYSVHTPRLQSFRLSGLLGCLVIVLAVSSN